MRAVVIFLLVGYVVYRFFRLFFGGVSSARTAYNKDSGHSEPNVHKPKNRGDKNDKNYRGGEYVDYEEVD